MSTTTTVRRPYAELRRLTLIPSRLPRSQAAPAVRGCSARACEYAQATDDAAGDDARMGRWRYAGGMRQSGTILHRCELDAA
jgi:hypothetical protein